DALDGDAATRPSLATTLLATCLDCARLHADLLSLAVALPAASTPARPRDFMLTAADAHRLRPRGLRRWLGLIGTSRDTLSRPLAIGFTTLGLTGLLVATVPGALPGSDLTNYGSGGGSPQREIQSAAPPTGPVVVNLGAQDTAGATDPRADALDPGAHPPHDPGVPPAFVALSSVFLVTGGALLVVRRARPRGQGR
ncbi:MAG: hypothetical protein ABIP77_04500, partial [Candidatus Limnocylindrales bacterium]